LSSNTFASFSIACRFHCVIRFGCTPHQIMSVTGHKTLAEVGRYTRAAEQERLNEEALAKQLANTRVPNSPAKIAKPIENKGKKHRAGAP
jgi:hypothetical protein